MLSAKEKFKNSLDFVVKGETYGPPELQIRLEVTLIIYYYYY